ncbi:MAG TPA: L-histidine N(alpha)-methyltransferase [Phenylobacterium sp.]
MHTENSTKFTVEGFEALAQKAGWRLEQSWQSSDPAFALVSLIG